MVRRTFSLLLLVVSTVVVATGHVSARGDQDNPYRSPWPATDLERRLPRQVEGTTFMIDGIDFSKVPNSQNINSLFAGAASLGPWLEAHGRSWKDVRHATAISDLSKMPSAGITLYQVVGASSADLLGYFHSLAWFRNPPAEPVMIAGRRVERAIDIGGGSAMYAWVEGDILYTIPTAAPPEFGAVVIAALAEVSDAEKKRD